MGLIDTLRKAEEQGRGAACRGMEKARGAMDDAERRLRRKMRLHPLPPDTEPEPLPTEIRPPVSSSTRVAEESLPKRASEEDAA
jgi:hypothetical protein